MIDHCGISSNVAHLINIVFIKYKYIEAHFILLLSLTSPTLIPYPGMCNHALF